MRGIGVTGLLVLGSCTMSNPAFEDGNEFGEGETRESLEGGTSSGEEGESGSSSSGSTDVDGESSGSTSASESTSTGTGETGSTSSDGETSFSTSETGSTSSDGETSLSTSSDGMDGVEMCIGVEPLDPCLACAADLCCNQAPADCFDPQSGCGCLVLCSLMLKPCDCVTLGIEELQAGQVVECVGMGCGVACL
ncbi:hypothetical protein ACNOYE_17895 [Nannocystaceae bacterium ST9]